MLWRDNMAVGVATIDQQHKELFKRLDLLMVSVESGVERKEVVLETINFLNDYVITHFDYEEGLMARYGYPHLESHRILHQQFKEDLNYLKEDYQVDGLNAGLAVNLIGQLSEWLMDHILDVDQEVGVFLRDRMQLAGVDPDLPDPKAP